MLNCIAVDRGHKHSDGKSVVQIWLKDAVANGPVIADGTGHFGSSDGAEITLASAGMLLQPTAPEPFALVSAMIPVVVEAGRPAEPAAVAEGPAVEAAVIRLVVKHQRGSVECTIKVTTPLRKLMTAHCSRLGLQASLVHFLARGEQIAPDDTAYSLGLQDGDVINVVEEGVREDMAEDT